MLVFILMTYTLAFSVVGSLLLSFFVVMREEWRYRKEQGLPLTRFSYPLSEVEEELVARRAGAVALASPLLFAVLLPITLLMKLLYGEEDL